MLFIWDSHIENKIQTKVINILAKLLSTRPKYVDMFFYNFYYTFIKKKLITQCCRPKFNPTRTLRPSSVHYTLSPRITYVVRLEFFSNDSHLSTITTTSFAHLNLSSVTIRLSTTTYLHFPINTLFALILT
jgi:hypothetical protein